MKFYKIFNVILETDSNSTPLFYFTKVSMFLLPYTELQEFNGCSSFSGQYHLTAVALRTGYFPF